MHKRRLSRRKRFLEGGQEYEIVGRGQYNGENDCWGRTREERKIFLWEGGKIVEEEIVDRGGKTVEEKVIPDLGRSGTLSREYEEEGKSSSWHEEEKQGTCFNSVVASVALRGMFVALSLGTCAEEKISRTCWGWPKPSDLYSMTKEGLEGLEGGERCLLSW